VRACREGCRQLRDATLAKLQYSLSRFGAGQRFSESCRGSHMRRKFAAQAEELRCSGKPQGCFIPSRERPIEPPNFGPFRGIKKGSPKQWGARRLFLHLRHSARAYPLLMDSKARSSALFYRASYRKTASRFSGRTLAPLAQSRSKIAAIPCPPPMHIVTSA
jgi:hypothetical protein